MSEEKNTTMPEDFDTSIAENLGDTKNTAEAPTPQPPAQPEVEMATNANETVDVSEDLGQENFDISNDELALTVEATEDVAANAEVVEDATGDVLEVSDEIPVNPADLDRPYSIYEDLSHDQDDAPQVTTIPENPADNITVADGSLEGVVFDNEVEMDAYFDGNVSFNDSENLETEGEFQEDELAKAPENTENA